MPNSSLFKLSAVSLISSSLLSTMAFARALDTSQSLGLFTRDSGTCPSGFSTCGQNLPSNFCCGTGSTCQVFNGGQSVVCCPSGSNCSSISPITCNIQELNATANPQNPLHSTDLTSQPSTCGAGTCCPAGYTCDSSGSVCNLNIQSSSPSTSSTPTSSGSTASGTPTRAISTSSATSTPSSGASSQSSVSAAACNPYPLPAILAAFFPGLVIGIIATILVIMCCGKRNRDTKRTSGDFGHINATVSDPIYQDAGATRTDFLRRESKTKNSAPSTSRVRSLFSRSPSIARPRLSDEAVPRTPENRPRREPSMESITIYSPPDGRFGGSGSDAGSRQTTITDMMKQMGVETPPYATYLGSPGRVDPRSKALGNGRLR